VEGGDTERIVAQLMKYEIEEIGLIKEKEYFPGDAYSVGQIVGLCHHKCVVRVQVSPAHTAIMVRPGCSCSCCFHSCSRPNDVIDNLC
jgi:hypothetical protein